MFASARHLMAAPLVVHRWSLIFVANFFLFNSKLNRLSWLPLPNSLCIVYPEFLCFSLDMFAFTCERCRYLFTPSNVAVSWEWIGWMACADEVSAPKVPFSFLPLQCSVQMCCNSRILCLLSLPVYDKQGFLLQLDTKLWVHKKHETTFHISN